MQLLKVSFLNSSKCVMASLLLGVFTLFSCQEKEPDAATQQTPDVPTEITTTARPQEPLFEISYPENSPYQGLTAPDGELDNPFDKIPAIAEEYKESPNWADKHADINGLLLQNQSKAYYFVLQQQAANEMLRHELFQHYYQDPGNQNVLKAIGTYTEHLQEANSVDSELIYKCLRALRDHWSKERIAQVALSTAARVAAIPVASAADTTTRNGSYRQIYARELKKMGNRMLGEG